MCFGCFVFDQSVNSAEIYNLNPDSSVIDCNGGNSCLAAKFSDAHSINCNGLISCMSLYSSETVWNNVGNIRCAGYGSCQSIQYNGVSQVIIIGETAATMGEFSSIGDTINPSTMIVIFDSATYGGTFKCLASDTCIFYYYGSSISSSVSIDCESTANCIYNKDDYSWLDSITVTNMVYPISDDDTTATDDDGDDNDASCDMLDCIESKKFENSFNGYWEAQGCYNNQGYYKLIDLSIYLYFSNENNNNSWYIGSTLGNINSNNFDYYCSETDLTKCSKKDWYSNENEQDKDAEIKESSASKCSDAAGSVGDTSGSDDSNSQKKKEKLEWWAILLIVGGIMAAITLIGILIGFYYFKKHGTKNVRIKTDPMDDKQYYLLGDNNYF